MQSCLNPCCTSGGDSPAEGKLKLFSVNPEQNRHRDDKLTIPSTNKELVFYRLASQGSLVNY